MKAPLHTNSIKTEGGFTIVEVLVALAIFSIAVSGVITVASQGGLNVNSAKNKLTATYLADEGVELVRGLRDTNVVSQPLGSEALGWDAFTAAVATCATGCDIDATNAAASDPFPNAANISPCVVTGCPLYYDTATGYYRNSWPIGTPPYSFFSRKIIVTPATDTVDVVVTVTWREGSRTLSLVQTETLFNWY